MRAELMILGKPVNLSSQARRRILVAGMYAVLLVALAVVGVFSRSAQGWRTGGSYLVFFALLLNRFLLGGYASGGLIPLFTNRPPQSTRVRRPYILLGLYVHPESPEKHWRNDERELQLRDRAHYQAYQVLACAMAPIWLLSGWSTPNHMLAAWLHVPTEDALFLVAMAAILLAITLPQSILLWKEPDMAGEQ